MYLHREYERLVYLENIDICNDIYVVAQREMLLFLWKFIFMFVKGKFIVSIYNASYSILVQETDYYYSASGIK